MRKPSQVLALVALSLALVACGKKNDQPVQQVGAIAPTGYYYPGPGGYYPTPGGGSYPDVQSFCQAYQQQGYNAQLVGSTCKFDSSLSISHSFAGYNYSWYPRDSYGNYVQIYVNDLVQVTASDPLTAYVNGTSQGSASHFVATTQGYLGLMAPGWESGSSSQVRIQRCYVMNGGAVGTAACP